MLKELVQDILLRQRPEHTEITEYGAYKEYRSKISTYNDAQKAYQVIDKNISNNSVRSWKAFCTYIKEELRRRNNSTGNFATVQINSKGGEFTADCNFNEGKCSYDRLHSELYNILSNYKDEVLDHEDFLLMLQKLKPGIKNFSELYKKCSKIRIVGRSEVNSTPIFNENGEAESGYICTYKMSDGTEEDMTLPAEFFVEIPFVKAGERKYSYHVELLFFNTKSSQIAVKVHVTDWETNEEQAIIDEANDIKQTLEEYPNLLVLADF